MSGVEARFIRRGDRVVLDNERVTVESVRSLKGGGVRIKWVGYEAEEFLGEDLLEVEARDTLATAFGPRRGRFGS